MVIFTRVKEKGIMTRKKKHIFKEKLVHCSHIPKYGLKERRWCYFKECRNFNPERIELEVDLFDK